MGLTQISTAGVKDDAVTASKLPADAVGASELADNAVDTAAIAADAVTGAKIADDAIDSEHLVDGSIDTAHIGADQITGAKIADDAIDSEHYTDGSIDTAHIADSQVTTAKIAADAITGAKIADDAIDSEHYTDGSIDTAHIGDNQVTAAKIGTNQVTSTEIADDAVGSDQLAAGALQTEHCGDNQISEVKLQVSNAPTNGYFLSAQSGNTGGLTWAEAGGGGKILQVLQSTRTDFISTTSATFADVLTQSITPSSTSSKILIFFHAMECTDAGDGNSYSRYKLMRDSTSIYNGDDGTTAVGASSGRFGRQSSFQADPVQIMYMDSPSSTSSITYKVQYASTRGPSWRVSIGGTFRDTASADTRSPTNLILMEVGA